MKNKVLIAQFLGIGTGKALEREGKDRSQGRSCQPMVMSLEPMGASCIMRCTNSTSNSLFLLKLIPS